MALEVADPTLGAKYQAELVEDVHEFYYDTLMAYLKAMMQDGFLPGSEPVRDKPEAYQQALPQAQAIFQKMAMAQQQGVPLNQAVTQREQTFLMNFFELQGELDEQAT